MTARFVYFIQAAGDQGQIKIGCSIHPDGRWQSLSLLSPVRLRLLASAPGEFAHENALHRRFAESRLHGEWFLPSKDLLAVIDHVTRLGALPVMELSDYRQRTYNQSVAVDPDALVAILGGFEAIATVTGVSANTVATWQCPSRAIPWKHKPAIARLAAEKAVNLPADFWGAPA